MMHTRMTFERFEKELGRHTIRETVRSIEYQLQTYHGVAAHDARAAAAILGVAQEELAHAGTHVKTFDDLKKTRWYDANAVRLYRAFCKGAFQI